MYKITDKKVQDYLRNNLNEDPALFALKSPPFQGISSAELSTQLKGLQVAQSKLPDFFSNYNIKYPPKISLEQCSSQLTAKYKVSLIGSGNKMADLSGGFGVDFYYLSEKFDESFYIDPNCDLLEIVKSNISSLSNKSRKYFCMKAEDFLNKNNDNFDLIFVDPSRRSVKNKKVVLWEDLLPNLIELYPTLKKTTKKILIKGSPMIDITSCINAFRDTTEVHVISVDREIKEVVILVDFERPTEDPSIVCSILSNSGEFIKHYNLSDLKEKVDTIGPASNYLYDPHPVFLKAGVENKLSKSYSLKKIAQNTNFYTSSELIEGFPGRIFKIDNKQISSLKEISKHIVDKKVNVITKNIPVTPEEILKKIKKKAGGTKWLIAYKNHTNTKTYNICTRVQ
ncbi:hypothetical protein OO013_18655 [Mangrovivirga sp. M17]|uniref:THUMP-like domain-containing protein n=1 Tax=Mangrovivirga halotolerans TaxID=2993936 RepID=A0ABT3RW87_9BACT|nr:hypothetical protein [Mangrovivirga halotolerans]MCX2745908.1 hypothetical protein [Mangrovivirga halotolerans]